MQFYFIKVLYIQLNFVYFFFISPYHLALKVDSLENK